MAHVDPWCFCGADDKTLEHLFFECEMAHLLVTWVFFNLMSCNPTARRFSVDELLLAFSAERHRAIPSIIIYMLQVMKRTIWVARCDFRFRQTRPIAHVCLSKAIAKAIHAFDREGLARGTLGHFEGEELVFSF